MTRIFLVQGGREPEGDHRRSGGDGGGSPAAAMNDDSIGKSAVACEFCVDFGRLIVVAGIGLQMALFDAVGKALNVPCWALLGTQV